MAQKIFGLDVAEEAEHSGTIAHSMGQLERAKTAWRLARSQWIGLGQIKRMEKLTTLLGET